MDPSVVGSEEEYVDVEVSDDTVGVVTVVSRVRELDSVV